MRVLVVTTVHHPLDARIHERQIDALLRAGHRVVYAAPFKARRVVSDHRDLVARDLPRSAGRNRRRALQAANRLVRRVGPSADVVLVHDPELVFVLLRQRRRLARAGTAAVWDVHEDTAGALVDKPWLPRPLRSLAARLVGRLESRAEKHLKLLLAEDAYAERFAQTWPVVRNTSWVPESLPELDAQPRVVHLGRLSTSRGVELLVEAARQLRDEVKFDVIGQADADVEVLVGRADDREKLVWHGFVPNHEALKIVEGAWVGLALLQPTRNAMVSMPSKINEYAARGAVVVTTALPPAAELVERMGAGRVVGFTDVDALVAAIRELIADRDELIRQREAAHTHMRRHRTWEKDGKRFVAALQRFADEANAAADARRTSEDPSDETAPPDKTTLP